MDGFDTDKAIVRYLRDHDHAGLTKVEGSAYELPWLGQPIPHGHAVYGELYAVLSATQAMLDDRAVDLQKWIVDSTLPLFIKQIGDAHWTNARIGRASILRDPYSAKPYVLFYVSAKAFDAEPPAPFA